MALLLERSTEGLEREVRDSVDEYIMEKWCQRRKELFSFLHCRFGS